MAASGDSYQRVLINREGSGRAGGDAMPPRPAAGGVGIARFGDRAAGPRRPGGVIPRNQAQVRRRCEPVILSQPPFPQPVPRQRALKRPSGTPVTGPLR